MLRSRNPGEPRPVDATEPNRRSARRQRTADRQPAARRSRVLFPARRSSMRHLLARTLAVLTLATGSLVAAGAPATAVVPKTPPLTTPWTSQVSTTNPLPEYPRP